MSKNKTQLRRTRRDALDYSKLADRSQSGTGSEKTETSSPRVPISQGTIATKKGRVFEVDRNLIVAARLQKFGHW
jgi:hypothetical protein